MATTAAEEEEEEGALKSCVSISTSLFVFFPQLTKAEVSVGVGGNGERLRRVGV